MIKLSNPDNLNAHSYFFVESTSDTALKYIRAELVNINRTRNVRLVTPCGECFDFTSKSKPTIAVIGGEFLTAAIIMNNPLQHWQGISPSVFAMMLNDSLTQFAMTKIELDANIGLSRQQIFNITKTTVPVKQTVLQSLLFTIARKQQDVMQDDKSKVTLLFDDVAYNHTFDGHNTMTSTIESDTGILPTHLFEVAKYINSRFDDEQGRGKYEFDLREFDLPRAKLESLTSVTLVASCNFRGKIQVTTNQ